MMNNVDDRINFVFIYFKYIFLKNIILSSADYWLCPTGGKAFEAFFSAECIRRS